MTQYPVLYPLSLISIKNLLDDIENPSINSFSFNTDTLSWIVKMKLYTFEKGLTIKGKFVLFVLQKYNQIYLSQIYVNDVNEIPETLNMFKNVL